MANYTVNKKSLALIVILMVMELAFLPTVQARPVLASGRGNCLPVIHDMLDPSDADSFWSKVTALLELGKKAKETGQVLQFKETFSEDEINSAIEKYIADYRDRAVAPKVIKVYLREDSVYGFAMLDILGMHISVSAVPDIQLEGGRPKVRLKSVDIQGAPGFLNAMILGIINQRIDAEYDRIIQTHKYDNLQVTGITLGYRQVTAAGIAR